MRLNDVLQNIIFSGNTDDREISGIAHDSRKVQKGTLFVAISGQTVDGHDFIPEAIQKGAVAVIANGQDIEELTVPIIHVSNPREAMSHAAANFFGHPSKDITIIGITGTNGKTSTCQLINHILNICNVQCGSMGTLGFSTPSGMISTGFTTPESVEVQQMLNTLRHGGINHAVMEISSHALEFHRVKDVDVDVAIYTHLSQDHLDYHKTMENYFKAKQTLFSGLTSANAAVINIDDEYAQRLIDITDASVITYGLKDNADIYPISADLSLTGINAQFSLMGQTIAISSSLLGQYNLYNILAAVSGIYALGHSPLTIARGVESFTNIPGRMEIINGNHKGLVILDYAHTPDAYENVQSTVRELAGDEKKIFTLFGCGGNRDKSKRPLMARIAEKYSDHIFVTSDNPRYEKLEDIIKDILMGFNIANYSIIHDRANAITEAMQCMDEDTILLVMGKGHDDYEEVDGHKIPHSDYETIQTFDNENKNTK